MAYFQILAIAGLFTIIALWRFNLVLSIVCTAGWGAFLAYYINNKPTGVVAGDVTDTFMLWGLGIMLFVIPLITIIRMRGRASRSIATMEGDEKRTMASGTPTLSGMTTDQYRAYIRTRLRRRR